MPTRFVDAGKFKGKIDHSTAGAQYIWNEMRKIGRAGQGALSAQILSICVASHHSGLINCLSADGTPTFLRRMSKDDQSSHLSECIDRADPALKARLTDLANTTLVKEICERIDGMVSLPPACASGFTETEAISLGLLVRFLFSCLVDADRSEQRRVRVSSKKDSSIESSWCTQLERWRLGDSRSTFPGCLRPPTSIVCVQRSRGNV